MDDGGVSRSEKALRLENLHFSECQLPSPCCVSKYKENVSVQIKGR